MATTIKKNESPLGQVVVAADPALADDGTMAITHVAPGDSHPLVQVFISGALATAGVSTFSAVRTSDTVVTVTNLTGGPANIKAVVLVPTL